MKKVLPKNTGIIILVKIIFLKILLLASFHLLEKFLSISFNSFELKDSYAFLGFSLDSLVQDLNDQKWGFPILKQSALCKTNSEFDNYKFKICSYGKGSLPYEQIQNVKYLYESTELPPIEDFYSSLTNETITQESYINAQEFWNAFKTENLAQYTANYCLLDTILLAEAMTKFRNEMFDFIKLEPARYLGLPGLSLDIFLKYTSAKIGLISQPEQFNMIERGLRGGHSYCSTRYLDASKTGEEIVDMDYNK